MENSIQTQTTLGAQHWVTTKVVVVGRDSAEVELASRPQALAVSQANRRWMLRLPLADV